MTGTSSEATRSATIADRQENSDETFSRIPIQIDLVHGMRGLRRNMSCPLQNVLFPASNDSLQHPCRIPDRHLRVLGFRGPGTGSWPRERGTDQRAATARH